MVGFGMMDNFVMIQAGDIIDNSIGAKLGLATLTAAACGQVCSDTCGVAFGGVMDAMVMKLGLKQPQLTLAQLNLRVSRLTRLAGALVGVITGCCIGMTSLLFLNLEAAEMEKRMQELTSLLETLLQDGPEIIGVDRISLFMWDQEKALLWTKVATGIKGAICVPESHGLVGEALRLKQLLNVADAYEHPKFSKEVDMMSGYRTRQVLAVPVMKNDHFYGVLMLINKRGEDISPFDTTQERLGLLMANHAATFLKNVDQGDGNLQRTSGRHPPSRPK